MTRRQQLITQMRQALNDLQSPAFEDYNETIVFEIAETEFEFSMEDLKEEGFFTD